MAGSNAVWGIEVGQCALKAVKIRPADDGKVEVVAFDVIEHAKLLSQPDADPDELIRAAIEKFMSRNDVERDGVVIGVPGQQTFARFTKLPPVEAKKIPNLVKFEASQQIPFDIEDVVWDYEVFTDDDSPETEVGIFAMRKDLIRKQIDYFAEFGVSPAAIQTLPCALYNFAHFEEGPAEEDEAVVLIDVGAQNTDLIVVERNSAWTRNIPLGGNNFTEALIKGFKLSFSKAESLKRTAATSKYARQIFQAMRPVFAELVSEIQRSLGFYSSTHRDVEIKRVVALGNAFRLPGLQKYLENNLTVPGGVHKPEQLKTVIPTETTQSSQFADSVLSLGAAYGLALQGIGAAKISASLLPIELARVAVWRRKTPFWMAAAACLALAAVSPWARSWMDSQALAAGEPQFRQAMGIVSDAERKVSEFNRVRQDTSAQIAQIEQLLDLRKDAYVLPRVLTLVFEAMPEPADPRLRSVQSAAEFRELVKSDPTLARTQRKQIVIEDLGITYAEDIAEFEGGETRRRQQPTPGMPGMGMPGMGSMGAALGRPPGSMGAAMGGRGRDRDRDKKKDVEGAGFYIHLRGRLLFGESRPQAVGVITEEFYPALQQLGSRADLGFYVLTDKPGERPEHFRPPVIRTVASEAGVQQPTLATRGGAPEQELDPLYKDPVTGESILTDWRFDFGFKIVLGEKPADDDADENEGRRR